MAEVERRAVSLSEFLSYWQFEHKAWPEGEMTKIKLLGFASMAFALTNHKTGNRLYASNAHLARHCGGISERAGQRLKAQCDAIGMTMWMPGEWHHEDGMPGRGIKIVVPSVPVNRGDNTVATIQSPNRVPSSTTKNQDVKTKDQENKGDSTVATIQSPNRVPSSTTKNQDVKTDRSLQAREGKTPNDTLGVPPATGGSKDLSPVDQFYMDRYGCTKAEFVGKAKDDPPDLNFTGPPDARDSAQDVESADPEHERAQRELWGEE